MDSYNKFLISIEKKKSLLCVGLDTDILKIPRQLLIKKDVIYEYNKIIIDNTFDLAAAYKINFAFYEQLGVKGFQSLKKTIKYIPDNIPIISDAKRGDIGNTSQKYADACFDYFNTDAVTVNPYMGFDSVSPFLEYRDKFVFLLALTSNKGSNDFQKLISNEKPIYQHIIEKSKLWAGKELIGYVIGASHPEELSEIRNMISDRFLLIPGVGAQGGNIEAVLKANANSPAFINVSRDIIFSSESDNFAEEIRKKALFYNKSLVSQFITENEN